MYSVYGVCAYLYVCPAVCGLHVKHMNVCMWRPHIRCLPYILRWGVLLNSEFTVSATLAGHLGSAISCFCFQGAGITSRLNIYPPFAWVLVIYTPLFKLAQ